MLSSSGLIGCGYRLRPTARLIAERARNPLVANTGERTPDFGHVGIDVAGPQESPRSPGLRAAPTRERIGLPVPSNGDPETRRCRVGARIGSGAADLGATDAEPGTRAWPTRDRDGAINSIGGSHDESHPNSSRATGRNDFSRGRADELRRDQVELETGHGKRALPCLEPMPRPIVSGICERALERATARRPRIDPRTACDRERLRLDPYRLEGNAICCLAHRYVNRSLASDLQSDRVRENPPEAAGA
jgi:hypothetical protein